MKITKKQMQAFSRVFCSDRNNKAYALLNAAFVDPSGALCACDGFMLARFFDGATLPELATVPRVSAAVLHERLFSMIQKAQESGATLEAVTKKADYAGEKPVVCADALRAFSRWANLKCVPGLFPVGNGFVSAARLARLLEVLPDGKIYAEENPCAPVYIVGSHGDAVLLPVSVNRYGGAEAARKHYREWESICAAETVSAGSDDDTAALPALMPFEPSCIRDAMQNTSETPIRVIGYKADGNTVCIHRVKAHHVIDNIFVHASKPDRYGHFAWRFVALFDCGFALDVDCLPEYIENVDKEGSNHMQTTFHGKPFADVVRAIGSVYKDDAAFAQCVQASVNNGHHVRLSWVRMLEEMGGHGDLISRVMECRKAREETREQEQRNREAEKQAAEEQRAQEHAIELEACRQSILKDGERISVDGRLLCELAAAAGITTCIKLKGWIMRKLANVTIENGCMVMYQFNRQKNTEKGSESFWGWMNQLLQVLHQQEEEPEEARSEDINHLFGRNNTPKMENQAQNLENEHRQPTRNDGADAWRSISSNTVCNLMNEKGVECDGDYREISNFSLAILRAGETLPAVDGETWMEFFERAYPVAFSEHNTPEAESQPVNLDTVTGPEHKNTINNAVTATQELYKQLRPIYGNLLYNVRFEHEDESGYWFSFELVGDTRRQTYCVRFWDLATDTG